MTKPETDRVSTADLARGSEYRTETTDERVVNRADAAPSTQGAESLWDKTVKSDPAARASDTKARADDAAKAQGERPRRQEGEGSTTDDVMLLFRDEDTSELSRRWSDIQASFVDQPRRAVELADSLVAETMQRLAQMFASARENLEHQWDRGEDVTTEDLRVTLQRYRAFFDRLLSV